MKLMVRSRAVAVVSTVCYTRLIEFGLMPTPVSRAQVTSVPARHFARIGAVMWRATAQLRHTGGYCCTTRATESRKLARPC